MHRVFVGRCQSSCAEVVGNSNEDKIVLVIIISTRIPTRHTRLTYGCTQPCASLASNSNPFVCHRMGTTTHGSSPNDGYGQTSDSMGNEMRWRQWLVNIIPFYRVIKSQTNPPAIIHGIINEYGDRYSLNSSALCFCCGGGCCCCLWLYSYVGRHAWSSSLHVPNVHCSRFFSSHALVVHTRRWFYLMLETGTEL